jgi:hypothetical protein
VSDGLGRLVVRAVDLDHQSAVVVDEIDDVAADLGLPADVGLQLAQVGPENLFRESLLAAKTPRAFGRAVEMARPCGDGVTPIPNPSPIKGEGSHVVAFAHRVRSSPSRNSVTPPSALAANRMVSVIGTGLNAA